jgi:hypothetical protein
MLNMKSQRGENKLEKYSRSRRSRCSPGPALLDGLSALNLMTSHWSLRWAERGKHTVADAQRGQPDEKHAVADAQRGQPDEKHAFARAQRGEPGEKHVIARAQRGQPSEKHTVAHPQ